MIFSKPSKGPGMFFCSRPSERLLKPFDNLLKVFGWLENVLKTLSLCMFEFCESALKMFEDCLRLPYST